MIILYNIGIFIYLILIRVTAIFKSKSQLWIDGRKNWKERLDYLSLDKNMRAWIHCASLGEFEQAKPLIEPLELSGFSVVVSFFSPSGYEVISKREDIQIVYLPLDTRSNAKAFLDLLHPSVAIFVRYEYWYHYLTELKQRDIPTYLVSASFREKQMFFQPIIGGWFRKILLNFSKIFVIDKDSEELLFSHNIPNVIFNGDTRADRVLEIASRGFDKSGIIGVSNNFDIILVAGSTWEEDEIGLDYALRDATGLLLIIAPHEIHPSNLKRCQEQFKQSIFYSELENYNDEEVIIIDNIGLLSTLYAVADVCYVGGGFGAGIHNVLEPAAHQKPVIFGPKFRKFPEARGLVGNLGALAISDRKELRQKLTELLVDEERRIAMGQSAFQYVRQLSGATQRIMEEIHPS